MDPDLIAQAQAVLDACRARKLTIAAAESCTGGLLAATLTDIPGSSDVFDRAFVTYSNAAKTALLGVSPLTLENFGAVSREAAEDLFHIQQMSGIGFDIELLYIAQKRGYRIVEVPINWYYNGDSKMRLVQDSLGIIREMFEREG